MKKLRPVGLRGKMDQEMLSMGVQKHHIIYKSGKNKKDVIRPIRKGVHAAVTLLRRFNYLTDVEINTIVVECMLKQQFGDE